MAVQLLTSVVDGIFTSTPGVVNTTVPNNPDRILLVFVGFSGPTTNAVISITGGGGPNSWQFAGSFTGASNHILEAWYLIAPATGAQTVTVNYTTPAVNNDAAVIVYNLSGVDQASAVDSFAGDASSVTITQTDGDMAVSAFNSPSTIGSGAGACNPAQDLSDAFDAFYAVTHCGTPTAPSAVMSWTPTSGAASCAVRVRQPTAPSGAYITTPFPGARGVLRRRV